MLRSHFSEIEKTITIISNYSINVPNEFIDPYSNDIMMLPIIGSDNYRYCAIHLMNAFKKEKKEDFIKIRKIDKLNFAFDFNLYQRICQFFSEKLTKDANLLNKTAHKDALIFVQKYAQGFVQEDEDIIGLVENRKKYGITITGLMKLPETRNFIMRTRISIMASMTVGNILPYIFSNNPTVVPIPEAFQF